MLNELRDKATDAGFHEKLSQSRHLFDDIESFYLSQLEDRDRMPTVEALWLNGADLIFAIANQGLKESQRIFKASGPGVMLL